MQDYGGRLLPIAFASRSMTPPGRGWAQIKKECLALTWACEEFSLSRGTASVQATNKPQTVSRYRSSTRRTCTRPQYVCSVCSSLMRFNGVCKHVPGKSLVVADALSRSKTTRSSLSETEQTFVDEVESYAENVMKTWPATSQKIKEISMETAMCPELSLADRYTRER